MMSLLLRFVARYWNRRGYTLTLTESGSGQVGQRTWKPVSATIAAVPTSTGKD